MRNRFFSLRNLFLNLDGMMTDILLMFRWLSAISLWISLILPFLVVMKLFLSILNTLMLISRWEWSISRKNIMWMCCYLKAKDPSKLRGIIESVPSHVYRDERMWNIRHSFLPPKIYADNEIAIFCGSSWEEWSPANILTGLGGSEEAVVYISRELVKLGYKVTVFNNCGESCGEYDGVEYKSYHAFNPKDKYNVVISWRGHDIRNVDAKNRIVWLHDVPMPKDRKS